MKALSFLFALLAAPHVFAADPAPPNYDDHIKPILRRHCLKCHGDDKQESGLNLQSFEAALKGGSGGKALVAGRSSASLLYQAITNEDADARMPPSQPPLSDEEIGTIRNWIDKGLLASATSKSLTAARNLSVQPATAGQRPEGPPPMPENLPAAPVPAVTHPLPIVSLAASPWAPLVAVAGQDHVRLVSTETRKDLGLLPFPEGVPHIVRFSRSGAVLLVAGGKPVQAGKAVLFDVRTGKRLAEIGDEVDAILAADLSPDQKLVAIGGSGKIVKVYATADGTLQYKLTRHTDWITSLRFSPDGRKLATADRAGGVHLWEAETGGLLLSLSEHKASVVALDWRGDSRLLTTAGEDGLLVWWDANDGWPAISKPNAHPPQRGPGVYGKLRSGILAATFGPGGELLTGGRDRIVRLWSPDGNERNSLPVPALPIATAIAADGKTLIAGDDKGGLHFWTAP